ncbi:xanthine dehydrogenase family protein molybdopterin-binding subunit [Parasegetibacter sp. NRK P23]|uniref:xanthine dehydrogenase family protein molybdopterin-binding subunit n=1 Tax=Parasegetibacter sp. NRK P23 TaxID=2942999 RepID=UPI0020444D37|nr:xanthine dehydrogenase family protein molybdopterin-binding subunit [Parasegetibacter sp. NRK P23]MCM5529631.1 xanthine dehydrogenase family protein molybdopterin-binding subunit [Parasegetibacter sp. NRK P23]
MGFFDNMNMPVTPPDGRVEGVAKVTGKGKYAAEYTVENVCYAVLVGSTVPAGSIKSIDLSTAKQVQGVLDIITHQHKPVVPGLSDENKIKEARFGLPVFHTDKIYFKGQPIAMVIAETLEDATYAASLVSAQYDTTAFNIDFETAHPNVPLSPAGKERGSMDAWKDAPFTIESEYNIAHEVHNPMEMHATIAHWVSDNRLKLYDKNQGVNNVQRTFSRLWSIPSENIEVFSEFVGGGFGSGLRVWPHALAAVMGAKQVNRPVKLMLTRPQMFMAVGYRPASWQWIKIGATADGQFTGVHHQAKHSTSVYENFGDGITRVTRLIYSFPNLKTEASIVPLNMSTPTWMRGPGDCTGDFAVESAIDELSYKLKMDPVALRLKNLAIEKDPESGKPWSTNFLNECVERGAAKIQWKNRKPVPGQLSEGDWKIGYGMAVGMWNAGRGNAGAGIVMEKNGTITVQTAMTDIGTGTGTAMQNIAHESTGITKNKIKIELGNSNLPAAPSQGGSTGLSSISGAVVATCNALKSKLASYAALQNDAYKQVKPEEVLLSDTGISLKTPGNQAISYAELWEKNNLSVVEVEASSGPGAERQQYAFCSSAAHFCKVRVHTKTGKVKIERMICVADGGKIVSEKAAANQMSGAAVGGIGMALMEEQAVDLKTGSLVGNDLAGYHFAVNADAPVIEVEFIGKPDPNINPSGSKGLGEVGIIGCAAAIANAIYNATGRRLRDLPMTPDKVLLAKVSG